MSIDKSIKEKAIEYAKYVIPTDDNGRRDGKDLRELIEKGYIQGAVEQEKINEVRITKLKKIKALLISEIHYKNRKIAKLISDLKN